MRNHLLRHCKNNRQTRFVRSTVAAAVAAASGTDVRKHIPGMGKLRPSNHIQPVNIF